MRIFGKHFLYVSSVKLIAYHTTSHPSILYPRIEMKFKVVGERSLIYHVSRIFLLTTVHSATKHFNTPFLWSPLLVETQSYSKRISRQPSVTSRFVLKIIGYSYSSGNLNTTLACSSLSVNAHPLITSIYLRKTYIGYSFTSLDGVSLTISTIHSRFSRSTWILYISQFSTTLYRSWYQYRTRDE